MKLLFVFLLYSPHAIALFGSDFALSEAKKMAESAAMTSILIDDVSNTLESGNFDEIESLAARHNDKAKELKNKRLITSDVYDRVSIPTNGFGSSKRTQYIKKYQTLIKGLCAISPESCQTAVSQIGNYKQDETTSAIENLRADLLRVEIKKEEEKLEENKKNSEIVRSVNNFPLVLIKKLKKSMNL